MNRQLQTQAKTTQKPFADVPSGLLQRAKGPECEEEECLRKRQTLQRYSTDRSEISEVPPIVHETLRSPGQPLDSEACAFFEPRFGQDFSQVRVHTDARAAESARAVNALAYTVGQNVVFGAGHYNLGTSVGKRLLAHELTHIAQYGSGVIQGKLEIDQPGDSFEQEADQVADRIILGHPPLLNNQGNYSSVPSRMILPYRDKGSFNFGRLDELGLKEEEFTNAKTQPWIEQVALKFDGTKTDSANDLVATGTLQAIYNSNKAALPDIKIKVVGGSTRLGLSDKGTGFKVHRIEGVGYNDVVPIDPEGKSYPKSKYSKSLNASMHYAVFFKGKQAIHGGALDIGSHSCVHVDWTNLHTIRQINYHSVVGKTKVDVSYDPGALATLCCSRMKILGVTKKGEAPNPCQSEDPKVCP